MEEDRGERTTGYSVIRPAHIDSQDLVSSEQVVYTVRSREISEGKLILEDKFGNNVYRAFDSARKQETADRKMLKKARFVAKGLEKDLTPEIVEIRPGDAKLGFYYSINSKK